MVSCHSVSVLGWVLGPLGEVGDSGAPWTTALGLLGIGGAVIRSLKPTWELLLGLDHL